MSYGRIKLYTFDAITPSPRGNNGVKTAYTCLVPIREYEFFFIFVNRLDGKKK